MEEVLKFLSSEPSIRSKAFMFVWRILIAIVLTNKYMNSHNYYFVAGNISFREIVGFIYSLEFIFVVSVYLIMIFTFFWLVKFFGIILSLIFNPSPDENTLNDYFRVFVHHRGGFSHFRNRKSLESVQLLAEQIRHIQNPIFEFVENRMNVLLANSFLIHILIDEIEKHELYKWWLNVLFYLNDVFLIVSIIVLIVLTYLNESYDTIITWIVNVSRRGYF
jgi:hypothetical protein